MPNSSRRTCEDLKQNTFFIMKNLFFGLIAIFAFSLVANAKAVPVSIVNNFNTIVEVEYSQDDLPRPCRWRTCTYYSDGTKSCGAWTYGYCLDEIIIPN